MYRLTKNISKEIYDRNKDNPGGRLNGSDYSEVFSISELIGYGVYGAYVREDDSKYFVDYDRGESCD